MVKRHPTRVVTIAEGPPMFKLPVRTWILNVSTASDPTLASSTDNYQSPTPAGKCGISTPPPTTREATNTGQVGQGGLWDTCSPLVGRRAAQGDGEGGCSVDGLPLTESTPGGRLEVG